MTFDATSREFCTVRRVRTNTPLQALTGLNDEAFFEAARALAASGRRAGPHHAATARQRRRSGSSRAGCPSDREVDAWSRSYKRQLAHYRARPAEAAKVMKAASPSPALAEQAAWTLVANALLNLDEMVTK